jgi:hypothetical protein
MPDAPCPVAQHAYPFSPARLSLQLDAPSPSGWTTMVIHLMHQALPTHAASPSGARHQPFPPPCPMNLCVIRGRKVKLSILAFPSSFVRLERFVFRKTDLSSDLCKIYVPLLTPDFCSLPHSSDESDLCSI